jgi:hypothetical protein
MPYYSIIEIPAAHPGNRSIGFDLNAGGQVTGVDAPSGALAFSLKAFLYQGTTTDLKNVPDGACCGQALNSFRDVVGFFFP